MIRLVKLTDYRGDELTIPLDQLPMELAVFLRDSEDEKILVEIQEVKGLTIEVQTHE